MTGTALASWADGAAKATVVDFVQRATSPGPDFVPIADRIACFDNDGTLWVEQPLPPQFDFVFRTWAEEVKADPSLAERQPYKALIEKDPVFFQGAATQDPLVVESLLQAFSRSWAGTTPDQFDAQVRGVADGWPSSPNWVRCTGTWSTGRCSRLPASRPRVPGLRLLRWWA